MPLVHAVAKQLLAALAAAETLPGAAGPAVTACGGGERGGGERGGERGGGEGGDSKRAKGSGGEAVAGGFARCIARCITGGGSGGDGGVEGGGEGGGGGGGEGGGEGGCGEGCEERLPCEAFLSVAAINLLRGVTPPHDAPGAAATEEYGRYGAEEPAQRYERVLHRPADALFCMQCATTYSLSASASLPTPHGAAAATGGREASAKE